MTPAFIIVAATFAFFIAERILPEANLGKMLIFRDEY